MLKRVLLFIIGIGCIGYISIQVLSQKESDAYNTLISPLAESVEHMSFLQASSVEKAVDSVLSAREGTYAVYYKDLKTGETYEKNADRQFESASLYKLWIMGELFHQIDQGKIKKEEMLKESVENLNKKFNIASESAERKEGEVALSVEDALEQMITVSDNYAALLLSARLRLSNVTSFLKTYGLTRSSIGVPPKTTSHDTGVFFEKLYKGELVGQIYSKEMQTILQRQRLNDRLPKYLPDSVFVAHKTGELGGFKHDGGIIYDPKGPYILVVLSESTNPHYAAETIALLSKAVYESR